MSKIPRGAQRAFKFSVALAIGTVSWVTWDHYETRKQMHIGIAGDLNRIKQKLADRGI